MTTGVRIFSRSGWTLAVVALIALAPRLPAQEAPLPATDSPRPANGNLPEERAIIRTEEGDIVVRMRPDLAPTHVERIKVLANDGFYDGLGFHRVIEDFIAQGGDPESSGRGKSQMPPLPGEFTNAPFVRGTVAMARRENNRDSANCQFFIMLADADRLVGQYTVWGEVVEGMDVVERFQVGSTANNGIVPEPTRIKQMRVVDGSGNLAQRRPTAPLEKTPPVAEAVEPASVDMVLPGTDGLPPIGTETSLPSQTPPN
ncbi:MAG: peptidylprolyl isomerase [Verrucomicrobiota bacterium]